MIRKMFVSSDIQRNVVVVDGILDQPVPTGVTVAEIRLADELSVRYVSQAVRDGHANLHRLDFISPLILVGPPDAGALAFARGEDPSAARRIFGKGKAAEASDCLRRSRIVEIDRVSLSGFQDSRKI